MESWILVYRDELCMWYAVQNFYQPFGSTRGYIQRSEAYRAGCKAYGKRNFEGRS